jgi:hypothetical protein
MSLAPAGISGKTVPQKPEHWRGYRGLQNIAVRVTPPRDSDHCSNFGAG